MENTGRLTSRATVYNAGNTICRNLLALDTRATPAEISFLHRIAGVYRVYRPPTSVSGDRVKSLPSPLTPRLLLPFLFPISQHFLLFAFMHLVANTKCLLFASFEIIQSGRRRSERTIANTFLLQDQPIPFSLLLL